MINKKGISTTLAALAIGLAVLVLVIILTLAILANVSPTLSSLACGVNTRIKAASPVVELVPLFMCKQYDTPVKIDGTNFDKCSEINKAICNQNTRGLLLDFCEQQCARMQVDALADLCWSVAGNGRLNFIGAGGGALSDNGILRCFRFQILEPTADSRNIEWKPIEFAKGNGSAYYALDNKIAYSDYANDPKTAGEYADIAATCQRQKTSENPKACELGGGVKAAIETGEISRGREDELDWGATRLRQVCYVSYVQDGGDRYIHRECTGWSPSFSKDPVDKRAFFFLN